MLPICDVIPSRTPPLATIALIAISVVIASIVGLAAAPVAVSMLCLWLFGWTVEDRLGRDRFVTLYGLCTGIAWMLSTPDEAIDAGVGGVMGAYFVLYPHASMLVLIPAPVMLVETPAVVFVGLWFLVQLLLGPFLPQLAGIAAGAVLGALIKRPERMRVEWWSP